MGIVSKGRTLLALAILFVLVSAPLILVVRTNSNLNPTVIEASESLSSTVHFRLPPSPPWNASEPVTVSYILTGQSIADHTPVLMNVSVAISLWAKGLWVMGPLTVSPDNAFAEETFSVNGKSHTFNFPTDLNIWMKNDTIGNEYAQASEWFELGSFGPFGATVKVDLIPSKLMWDYAFSTQNFAAFKTLQFEVHNFTTISIDSSKAVSAQAIATRAAQDNISLTWLVIFLAAVQVATPAISTVLKRSRNRVTDYTGTEA